jgi:hypothetical protein
MLDDISNLILLALLSPKKQTPKTAKELKKYLPSDKMMGNYKILPNLISGIHLESVRHLEAVYANDVDKTRLRIEINYHLYKVVLPSNANKDVVGRNGPPLPEGTPSGRKIGHRNIRSSREKNPVGHFGLTAIEDAISVKAVLMTNGRPSTKDNKGMVQLPRLTEKEVLWVEDVVAEVMDNLKKDGLQKLGQKPK